MTQSEQILDNLRGILLQLRAELNGAKNVPPPDPQAAAAFNRFVLVLGFLEARLKTIDAALIPTPQSQNLQNQLQSLLNLFKSFLKNAAQVQQSQQLTNLLDQVLVMITAIPIVAAESAADQYSVALSDFLRLSDQAVKLAEDRAAKMEERVKALDASTTAVDARAKDIQGQVNQEKARLDKIILDSQGLIAKLVGDEQTRYGEAEKQRIKIATDGEAKRDADTNAKLAEFAKKFDEMVAANQKEFLNIINTHRNSADARVTELSKQLEEAKKIVDLIANTGMAGHYQLIADREWKWMWIMRWVAGVFFLGAIGAIAWLIVGVHSAQVDWEMVVFRFALVVVVLVPAFYFARESGRHLQREAHNRRIELELPALQPFLARLPEKDAQDIIKAKANQYFGQEPSPGQDENNLLRDVSLRGDQVLKVLTKVLAAWRGK